MRGPLKSRDSGPPEHNSPVCPFTLFLPGAAAPPL